MAAAFMNSDSCFCLQMLSIWTGVHSCHLVKNKSTNETPAYLSVKDENTYFCRQFFYNFYVGIKSGPICSSGQCEIKAVAHIN